MMLIKDFMALSKEAREQISISLDFSNQSIGDLRGEALNAFCEALGQCHQVPEINLSCNYLVMDSLVGLKNALSKCIKLRSLILEEPWVDPGLFYVEPNLAKLLGEVISQCPTLESLDLTGAALDKNIRFVIKNCPQLKILILKNNRLHDYSELGDLLSKACPQLRVLDLANNLYLSSLRKDFFSANKNLYEIRGLEAPLMPAQLRGLKILKNRYIQQMIKRANEIAIDTGIPNELALLTTHYDNTLPTPNITEQEIVELTSAGMKRFWALQPSLAKKQRWDLAKNWSMTAATFILTLAFSPLIFSWFPLLSGFSTLGIAAMKALFACAMSSIVFKMFNRYINKRNDDLRDAAMLDPSVLKENQSEQARLRTAFKHGKESVKHWSPYFRYCLLKAKCQLVDRYNEYWDKGYVEGLIEGNKPAQRERAAP